MTSVASPKGRLQALTATDISPNNALRIPQLLANGASSAKPLPPPVRRSRRTRAHKAAERPPVVSRRMRRLHNDAQLALSAAEIAGPLSAEDFKSLFETSSRSHFQRLSERPNARAWASFVELDERAQADALTSPHRARRTPAVESGRDALLRIDGKIRNLFKQRLGYVRPIVKDVEQRVVELGPGASLSLRLPHATFRMVAHGVAQFYRLGHRSLGHGNDRITVIEKGEVLESIPDTSLFEVLA